MFIVSFGLHVPYIGVPHAGGLYYYRHIQALELLGHDVLMFAPRTKENEKGKSLFDGKTTIELIGEFRESFLRKASRRIATGRNPARYERGFSDAFRENQRVIDLTSKADLIEFQWAQMSDCCPSSTINSTPSVFVPHDVLRQRYARRSHQAPWWRPELRAAQLLRSITAGRSEDRACQRSSLTLVFSEKDAELLNERQLVPRAKCIRPPLAEDVRASQTRSDLLSEATGRPTVLFVGAMWRKENDDAARWFLQHIWPHVQREVPGARFVIAGAGPSTALLEIADGRDDIKVTGFVHDLAAYYDHASVVVVPLREGAGVKFKVVEALLRDLPVVTTSVGAEGIWSGAETLRAICDSPTDFAAATVAALLEMNPHLDAVAMERLRDAYSMHQFTANLSQHLRELKGP
jgi:glycosyltransferase involved in cell wall biosynthesis